MSSQLFDVHPVSFDAELWNSAQDLSVASLFALAETHTRKPYFALQVMLRHCSSSPLALIEKYMDYFHGIEISLSTRVSDGGVVKLTSADGQLTTSLACLPGQQPGIWLLCTAAKARTDEYDKMIAPILERLAARIQPGWLSSSELESALMSFQRATGGRVSPSRVASRGFDRSTIEYLQAATLEQVVSELRESQLLMQSIEFKLLPKDRKSILLAGAVNRSMRVVYRGGTSRLLELYLLPELEVLLATHFGHVAIHENEWSERRIVYKFERGALMSRENHNRLVDALTEQPKLMVCAFHLNPYLNLAVTDLVDGSSMNLISDSPDAMYVMPGRRCSSGAVSRVLDTVYAQFAAGRVLRDDGPLSDWMQSCKAGS